MHFCLHKFIQNSSINSVLEFLQSFLNKASLIPSLLPQIIYSKFLQRFYREFLQNFCCNVCRLFFPIFFAVFFPKKNLTFFYALYQELVSRFFLNEFLQTLFPELIQESLQGLFIVFLPRLLQN